MSLRERLIAAGRIRPQTAEQAAARELRAAMIADGRIAIPNNDGEDFVTRYWAFMVRWSDKGSRRWESPRKGKYSGVWH